MGPLARVAGVCVACIGCAFVLQGCGGGGAGEPDKPYVCSEKQTEYGCTACESEKKCTECKTDYNKDTKLKDGCAERTDSANPCNATVDTIESCEWPCNSGEMFRGCTKCISDEKCYACAEGFLAKDGLCDWQCDAAQTEAGCTECDHATKCVKCKEGQVLVKADGYEATCGYECTAEQVANRCTSCNNKGTPKCELCKEGYALLGDECVAECLTKGEDDLRKPDSMDPKVRNGYEWQRMCVDEDEGKWFIIGDWGGAWGGSVHGGNYLFGGNGAAANNAHTYAYDTNGGLDRRAQKAVADAMNARGRTAKPRFVVNVGDSFYWGGFEELGCGGDPRKGWNAARWRDVFETKYDLPHPTVPSQKIPWMGVLGNHDLGGRHFDSGWDHQIYYTYKNTGSRRWRMPGLWWSQKIMWKRFSLEIWFMDGNVIAGKPLGVDPDHNVCGKAQGPAGGNCAGAGLEGQGVINLQTCFKWHQKNYADQLEWLKKGLACSRADYTAVVSHYQANCHEPVLQNTMKDNGVDMCIVGHTHWNVIGQRQMPNSRPASHCEPSENKDPNCVPALPGKPCKMCTPCSPDNPCDNVLEIVAGGGGGISAEAKAGPGGTCPTCYGFVEIRMTPIELTAYIVNYDGKAFDEHAWKLPPRKKVALENERPGTCDVSTAATAA